MAWRLREPRRQEFESSRGRELSDAPGPKGYPLVGCATEILRDTLGFYTRVARQYGDIVRVPEGKFNAVFLTNPREIRHVLLENSRNYWKSGPIYDPMRALLGRGLILVEGGDRWRRQRKLTQPAFHPESLREFVRVFNRCSDGMIDRWTSAGRETPIEALGEMMRVTLHIVGHTLLSVDLSDNASTVAWSLTEILRECERRMNSASTLTNYFPLPRTFRARKAKRALDNLVFGIIAERRQSASTGMRDLLDSYLAVRDDETGRNLSDEEIRDEVLNIFIAGHETTASTLAWIWHLLPRHPEIELKLREEVDRVLGGRRPELEDFPRLRYMEMVILETLRLYPPAWMIARQAQEDDAVGGYRIPAGTVVLLSAWVTQRDPRFWPDPLRFDPERFSDEKASRAVRFDFFPFAAGPRVCAGQRFAMIEAQTLLARVLQAFDVKSAGPASVDPHPKITLRPGSPILIRPAPRRTSPSPQAEPEQVKTFHRTCGGGEAH
jgi:cytochrome P450